MIILVKFCSLHLYLATENKSLVKTEQNAHLCSGCKMPITDRYLLEALGLYWHEGCLKCNCCECKLGDIGSTLYNKANLILCKRDYLRSVKTIPFQSSKLTSNQVQRRFIMNLIGSNVLVSLATTNEVNQNTVTWILVQIKISVARTVKKEKWRKRNIF